MSDRDKIPPWFATAPAQRCSPLASLALDALSRRAFFDRAAIFSLLSDRLYVRLGFPLGCLGI